MRTFFIRNLALIVMVLISGNLAFGQGYVFRVLANKGANQVKRATGTTEGLKTGATLKTGDQILAGDGAYIGLMHKTGKTLEIRQSGVIKVNDLEKKVAAIKTSVTSRYAQYVMNKINEEEGGIRKNYRNSMNATGATKRALGVDEIAFFSPEGENKMEVYSSVLTIKWTALQDDPTYVVSVKNIFNEELLKTETNVTAINLNFDDESMVNESGLYIVKVSLKGNEEVSSDDLAIKRTKLEDKPELKAELEGLLAEVDGETAMGKVIMATFYDENGLVLDAFANYDKLVEENPEVTDFQELRDEFLAKNKMGSLIEYLKTVK